MYALCFLVGKYSTEVVFDRTNSRMKWDRASMCLVLAELSGVVAKAIAPSLSANTLKHFSERDGRMKDNTDFTEFP